MIRQLNIKVLPHACENGLPNYTTSGSAGMDLKAALDDKVIIKSGETFLCPTGLVFEIPPGFEGQIRPRSGLALKSGVTVLNTPGTIDSDYRGEVKVLLINLGKEDFIVKHSMRIAQVIITRYERFEPIPSDELNPTIRGKGGFGSTGLL